MTKLRVKVVPRAARSELAGWQGDRLRIRIAAVPESGRANAALIEFISRTLRVPKRSVRVVAGQTSTLKTLQIEGLGTEEVMARIA